MRGFVFAAVFVASSAWADPPRELIVAQYLTVAQQMTLAANHAAAKHPSVLLFDTGKTHPAVSHFDDLFEPAKRTLIRPAGKDEPLGKMTLLPWPDAAPLPDEVLAWFPDAQAAVACSAAADRATHLLAARLAIARGVPFVTAESPGLAWFRDRKWRELVWAGPMSPDATLPGDVTVYKTSADLVALIAAATKGPVTSLVLTNPHDLDRGDASRWAAWVAGTRNAALVFTNPAGDDASALLARAGGEPLTREADTVLVLGNHRAVPMERRANPIAGKDEFIEMEPGTPTGTEPHTWAVGRLHHDDPAALPLWLARAKLLPGDRPRRAFVASNPGSSLNLLETFSRTSGKELANAGYRTVGKYGSEVSPADLRSYLPQSDVYLWEGHHNTLIKDWGFAKWDEPLPPNLVMLQSCLALAPEKALPLIDRGSIAVVGASTRIYSATGGAFSLSYLNGLLYDGQSLGGGLRQSKNFLLAFTLVKQQRLGESMRLAGANLRSSWAFSLWGDPALTLPPPADKPVEPPVRFKLTGDTLRLTLPATVLDKSQFKYQVAYRPNARMAGYTHTTEDAKTLVSMAFAEVPCPDAPAGQRPKFAGKIAASNVATVWDARRKVASVLVLVQKDTAHEIALTRTWEPAAPSPMLP